MGELLIPLSKRRHPEAVIKVWRHVENSSIMGPTMVLVMVDPLMLVSVKYDSRLHVFHDENTPQLTKK